MNMTPKEAADRIYEILLDGSKGGAENYLRVVAFMAELMGEYHEREAKA